MDREGRALQTLENVHLNDITGPTADKALFWCGFVNFYRGNFVEADHYFSTLIEFHKDSPLRPKATELAIISKNNSTGGSVYDGQKASEALQLVNHAEASMPEFTDTERRDFLTRQKLAIRAQQAEKDFKTAEYHEQTKHPGSAYFCYEIVRRRYPGTKYSDLATERMEAIRVKAEADAGKPKTIGPVQAAVQQIETVLGGAPPVPTTPGILPQSVTVPQPGNSPP
jgi:outer membrane protein assembly factor BamD (BamD/ComL family)